MNKKDETAEERKVTEMIRVIMDEEDIEQLTLYRKKFKKMIPFMRRSWVTAYLLKEYLTKGKERHRDRKRDEANGKRRDSEKTRSKEGSGRARRGETESREGWVNLYFSIGKNKKMFRKNIVALLEKECRVKESSIGTIKTLDHFSFVLVKEEVAPSIVNKMDGFILKGKPLKVNVAKEKER